MEHLSDAVRRYAATRGIIRVGGAVIWFGAWSLALMIYCNQWDTVPDPRMVIFASCLAVIGVFITGLPRLILCGTVEGVVVERTVTEAFAPFTRGGDDESNRMMQILKIKLDDGRTVTQKCPNRENFIDAFKTGTRVRRYRLLRIPEPLDGEYAGKLCLICGGTSDENGNCVYCGKEIR